MKKLVFAAEQLIDSLDNRPVEEYLDPRRSDNDLNALVTILKKPILRRRRREKQVLLNYFSTSKFFEEFMKEADESAMDALCCQLQYSHVPAGHIIFRCGDRGHQWFYIIRGGVNILIPKNKINATVAAEDPEVSDEQKRGGDEDDEIPRETRDEMKNYQKVNELSSGDSFGEIALRLNVTRY
jgi:CRP-like cAMP-binding protein